MHNTWFLYKFASFYCIGIKLRTPWNRNEAARTSLELGKIEDYNHVMYKVQPFNNHTLSPRIINHYTGYFRIHLHVVCPKPEIVLVQPRIISLGSEGRSTSWTCQPLAQPRVDAVSMELMMASWKNSANLRVPEILQTDGACWAIRSCLMVETSYFLQLLDWYVEIWTVVRRVRILIIGNRAFLVLTYEIDDEVAAHDVDDEDAHDADEREGRRQLGQQGDHYFCVLMWKCWLKLDVYRMNEVWTWSKYCLHVKLLLILFWRVCDSWLFFGGLCKQSLNQLRPILAMILNSNTYNT